MATKVKTLKEGHIICTGIGTKVEKKGTSHAHTQKSGYRSTMATERYTADTIRKGKDMAVSDGSAKYQWVTETITIEGNTQGKYIIEAPCTTPGLPRGQDVHISEISGIIHVIKIVEIFTSKFNITEGSITLGCYGIDATRMALD